MESILLSAGQSSRMGENKALMEIKGSKSIDLILSKLIKFSSKIIIVLGSNYKEVKDYLNSSEALDDKITLVYNKDHHLGMFSSIKKGFTYTSGNEPVLMQMIDQPFVSLQLYIDLIKLVDSENMIFQPASNDKDQIRAGHPLIFSPGFKEVLKLHENAHDLRMIIRKYSQLRKFLYTDDNSVFMNLNTPDDLEKLTFTE